MAQRSAGILLYRRRGETLEVFLVHPGGPLWKTKDRGAWSLPKGLCEEGEDPLVAAQREFREETGFSCDGFFLPLGELRQRSGKRVLAWTVEGDCDAAATRSNRFAMEWPPGSGLQQEFPEVDRAAWFPVPVAAGKLVRGQVEFLQRLCDLLGHDFANSGT